MPNSLPCLFHRFSRLGDLLSIVGQNLIILVVQIVSLFGIIVHVLSVALFAQPSIQTRNDLFVLFKLVFEDFDTLLKLGNAAGLRLKKKELLFLQISISKPPNKTYITVYILSQLGVCVHRRVQQKTHENKNGQAHKNKDFGWGH